MNSGEGQDRSAPDARTSGDGAPKHRAADETEPTEAIPRPTRPLPPDDRLTTVMAPVRDDASSREQVQAVKAALDGGSPPTPAPPAPTRRSPVPHDGEPDLWQRLRGWGARRWLAAAAVVFVVLPVVTFGMAYLIVTVPKPGDIRTNQVSTILASDGSEIAKVIPPEGNRVDVNIDQVPVHVRDAVMAAEDRDFYSNPGFSITGFGRAVRNRKVS